MKIKKGIGLVLMILLFFGVFLTSSGAQVKAEDFYLHSGTWTDIFSKKETVDYPLLFLHGLAGNPASWEKTIKTISGNEYYEMRYFDHKRIFHNYHGEPPERWFWNLSYYTLNTVNEAISGDLTTYTDRLTEMIKLVKKFSGKDRVIIIAHSMGGLVARKYMTKDQQSWDSVYRLLSIATPHNGIDLPIGIINQLEDLKTDSYFLKELNEDWARMASLNPTKKWGVVGGIDSDSFLNKQLSDSKKTDSGGPGYITISSAIPYEWEEAIAQLDQATYDTEHFGFRMAVESSHTGIVFHAGTLEGIHWAVTADFQ